MAGKACLRLSTEYHSDRARCITMVQPNQKGRRHYWIYDPRIRVRNVTSNLQRRGKREEASKKAIGTISVDKAKFSFHSCPYDTMTGSRHPSERFAGLIRCPSSIGGIFDFAAVGNTTPTFRFLLRLLCKRHSASNFSDSVGRWRQ
jgi:hypothetical protein